MKIFTLILVSVFLFCSVGFGQDKAVVNKKANKVINKKLKNKRIIRKELFVPNDRTLLNKYMKKWNKQLPAEAEIKEKKEFMDRFSSLVAIYKLKPKNVKYYKMGLMDEHYMIRQMAKHFVRKNLKKDLSKTIISQCIKERKRKLNLNKEKFFKIFEKMKKIRKKTPIRLSHAFISPYREELELISLYSTDAIPYVKEIVFNSMEDSYLQDMIMSCVVNKLYNEGKNIQKWDLILDVLNKKGKNPPAHLVINYINPLLPAKDVTRKQLMRIKKFLKNYHKNKKKYDYKIGRYRIKDVENFVKRWEAANK